MVSRKKTPANPNKSAENKAVSGRGQKAKLLGLAVGIIVVAAVALAVFKGERPSTPENTAGAEPKTRTKVNETAHWQPEEQSKAFAQYAGSKSCRECHQASYDLWMGSDHQLAERLPDPKMDRRAFDPPREFKHPSLTSDITSEGDRFLIATLGLSGKKETFEVERVIGETPIRQYLVELPRGRLQAVDLSHDPHKNEWFNVFGDEDRQAGEWGHWTGRGMNWNTQCASCHNTRLRKNYDEATDSYDTEMAEMSVGCEACHGPMKAHVDWRNGARRDDRQRPDAAQVRQHTMARGLRQMPLAPHGVDGGLPSPASGISTTSRMSFPTRRKFTMRTARCGRRTTCSPLFSAAKCTTPACAAWTATSRIPPRYCKRATRSACAATRARTPTARKLIRPPTRITS